MTLDTTLAVLLGPVPAPLPVETIEDLDRRSDGIESTIASTVERALLGGFSADRIGVAFAFGYRAALTRLAPNVAKRACLAATEAGGAHPRTIRTTLREEAGAFVLDGTKSWVTLGTAAEEILVVASTGEVDGKNRLRVVRLPADRRGVTLVARAPAPFAPEVPHSEATFQNVHIAPNEILPGDGYERYLKPFRTIEDLHVLAGFTGYLVSLARRGQWGNPAVEELVAFALADRKSVV